MSYGLDNQNEEWVVILKVLMDYQIRMKNLREDNDMNQTQAAMVIHVAQTTYSDYEKGKVRIPVEYLIELAKYYDVDMNYMLGLSNKSQCFPKK